MFSHNCGDCRTRRSRKISITNERNHLENKIKSAYQEGLEEKYTVDKERGVFTTRRFTEREFVVEYMGELIDGMTAQQREKQYAENPAIGCYMYYFRFRGHDYCIDATPESNHLGRLVNHSRRGNLVTKIVEVDSIPHLVLFARKNIPIGVEKTYDYGDRRQSAIEQYPWLAE